MSKGSFQLGKFAGIPLKLHWTFGLTFILVLVIGIVKKSDLSEIGVVLILLTVMFVCVVFHEYGHALMARRFKVKTIDIILSPIGGLARLERLPSKPIQEFYIAVAGPLVNAVIALILATILFFSSKPIIVNMRLSVEDVNNWQGYMSLILLMNLMLFLFNLIPAFPMDGGRILRSLLSIKLGKTKSTIIASYIGYAFALSFIAFSFYKSYYLLSIIGLFVIVMARGELVSARQEDFLNTNLLNIKGLKNLKKFHAKSQMSEVISYYHDYNTAHFMVVDESDKLLGVITEDSIQKVIKDQTFGTLAEDNMEKNFEIDPITSLQSALNLMNLRQSKYLLFEEQVEHFLVEKRSILKLIRGKF